MAFMVVRGSVWPRMEFWTGQGGKPGSQRRQEDVAPQSPPTGLSPGHSPCSAARLGAAGSLLGGACALRVPPHPPPRARPCRSTPTVTGGSALGSWVWVPGRHLITKYLSLLPIPSSCPVVGPLQPGGTWGQDLESPGCMGPSPGRPPPARGVGRGGAASSPLGCFLAFRLDRFGGSGFCWEKLKRQREKHRSLFTPRPLPSP